MTAPAPETPIDPHAPIVLVHGFATSAARTWRDNGWLDLIADAGRQAIAPDLLGHGTAPKPHDPSAYDQLEDRLLAELPAQPVDAIGFSLGARCLLVLAGRHPERFQRLVVAGVGANLFSTDGSDPLRAAFGGDGDPDNPIVQHFRALADSPEADPEALAAFLERPHHVPLSDAELARIDCPVLVVLGDRDFAGPAEPLLERLAQARLVELRGVDHFATPKSFEFLDAALAFVGAG